MTRSVRKRKVVLGYVIVNDPNTDEAYCATGAIYKTEEEAQKVVDSAAIISDGVDRVGICGVYLSSIGHLGYQWLAVEDWRTKPRNTLKKKS